MNQVHIAALLTLGLSTGLVGCQSSTNNDMAPGATEAPSGLRTAQYLFTKERPL